MNTLPNNSDVRGSTMPNGNNSRVQEPIIEAKHKSTAEPNRHTSRAQQLTKAGTATWSSQPNGRSTPSTIRGDWYIWLSIVYCLPCFARTYWLVQLVRLKSEGHFYSRCLISVLEKLSAFIRAVPGGLKGDCFILVYF